MIKWIVSVSAAVLVASCSKPADVQTTDGETLSWQQQDTTVVVNYFAEWCAPCLRELPELNEFYHDDVKDDPQLKLIGVSFDALNNEQINDLAVRHSIDYPLALAQPVAKFPFERPKMLPATYVIFPDGKVTGPMMGEQTLGSLRQAVKSSH